MAAEMAGKLGETFSSHSPNKQKVYEANGSLAETCRTHVKKNDIHTDTHASHEKTLTAIATC